jgi:hypothetical protein
MSAVSNKPMAVKGLQSYRYNGRFGHIMIGANSVEEALSEARRSTDYPVEVSALDVWDGSKYIPVEQKGA